MTFEVDPVPDGELRGQLAALWAEVTTVGGAVRLVPPVTDAPWKGTLPVDR